MGMNWAGFQGLGQGFETGMRIGGAIKDSINDYKISKVREQGMAEAEAMRQNDINGAVKDNGEGDKPATTGSAQGAGDDGNYFSLERQKRMASEGGISPEVAPSGQAPAAAGAPQPSGPQEGNAMIPQEMQGAAAATGAPDTAAPAQPGGMPTMQGSPAAEGIAKAKKRFSVGNMGFDTHEEALTHAKKNTAPLMDYITKTMVPKMQEALVAQGDIPKAEAWGKWAEDKANKRHMESWASAKRSADIGDFEGAAKHLGSLYKDFNDGMSIEGQEPVKDKDGKLTGFNLKIKTDATGETRSQFVDPPTLMNMGLSALSPPAMFEMAQKQQQSADTLKAKAAIDAQNDQRTAVRQEQTDIRRDARMEKADIRRDQREQGKLETQNKHKLEQIAKEADVDLASIGKKERAKLESKVDILRENGLSPDAIRELIPHMVGGDGYKKTTDPVERRAIVTDNLVKNDPTFAREKDPAKQKAKVDQMMSVIYGNPNGTPKPGAAPAAPAAAAPAAAPKPKGTPYMKPDGTITYM